MKAIPFRAAVMEIGQSPYYRAIVEKVESTRPVIPIFNYTGESNIEEIKYKLAQLQMHELVMSILNPKGNENE